MLNPNSTAALISGIICLCLVATAADAARQIHVAQVFAGMAGSHDADVGPWKVYSGILLRRDDPAAVPR